MPGCIIEVSYTVIVRKGQDLNQPPVMDH